MVPVMIVLLCGFTPIGPAAPRQHLTPARPPPRAGTLIAPMAELQLALQHGPQPRDDWGLYATLPGPEVPDAMLRLTVSLCRITAGAGASGYAMHAAHMTWGLAQSTRSLLTLHGVGTFRAASGLRQMMRNPPPPDTESGVSGTRGVLPGLQYASMLLLNPLEFWRWWGKVFPRVAPSAPNAVRQIASSFWLLWIACTCLVSLRKLRAQPSALERRTLRRQLLKLVLDAPVAVNFSLAQPVLPLFCVGVLGVLSSWQALQMALESPAKPRVVPLPAISKPDLQRQLSRARRRIPPSISRDGVPRAIPLCSSRDGLPRIPLCSSRDGLPRAIPLCSSRDGLPRAIPQCSSRDGLAVA